MRKALNPTRDTEEEEQARKIEVQRWLDNYSKWLLSEDRELPNFVELENEWSTLFNAYVWNNDIYHKLLLHSLLGQLLRNLRLVKGGIKIDGRTSTLIIQDQGTAKDVPLVPFAQLCKALDRWMIENGINRRLRYTQNLTDFTQAALIGSIEEIVHRDRSIERRDIRGVLHRDVSDFIEIQEGRRVLALGSKLDDYTIQYINNSLSSIHTGNAQRKMLRSGEVVCESVCSYLITSYPTEEMSIELLHSGFFRRFLVHYNPIPPDEKFHNMIRGTEQLPKSHDAIEATNRAVEISLKVITRFLTKLITRYANQPYIDIIITEKAEQQLKSTINGWREITKNELSKEVGDILFAFVDSYINTHAVVIAGHRALVDGRDTITETDIIYSLTIVNKLLSELSLLVERIIGTQSNYYRNLERDELFSLSQICWYLNSTSLRLG